METRTSKRGRGGKNSSAQKHSTTPPAQADGHSRPTMSMLTPRKHSEQSPALELPVLHYGSADDRDSPPSLTMVHQQVIEFQKCVQDAMDLLLKGMRKLENDLGASIEYQSRRIADLEGRLQPLEAQKTACYLLFSINYSNLLCSTSYLVLPDHRTNISKVCI